MRRWLWLALIAALVVVGYRLGGVDHRPPPVASREERVDAAFARAADAVVAKERVAAAPTAHVFVAGGRLGDGTEVTLWAADPATTAGIRSRCWYLDVSTLDGGAGGYSGCGGGDEHVSLSGDRGFMIGAVGTWPAHSVRVASWGGTVEVPVTAGHFLVFGLDPAALVTITLLDSRGSLIGAVRDLRAPGSAVPS